MSVMLRALPTSITIVLLALFAYFALVPHSAAQSVQEELQVAVRTVLLSDPRATALPQDQLDEMILALAVAVEKKGITARDITWNPEPESHFTPTSLADVSAQSCGAGAFLCSLSSAFGFTGSDATIPIWLGIVSSVLILVMFAMFQMHRKNALSEVIK